MPIRNLLRFGLASAAVLALAVPALAQPVTIRLASKDLLTTNPDDVRLIEEIEAGLKAKGLDIEIVAMMGAGGGMWSGPKQMTVVGTLTEGGAVVGTFRARRTTTGGAWGGYKGTCSLLGRVGKALAKDIGDWLRAPTNDARLGEL